MQKFIAIIDDEPDILDLVSINLKKANFHVEAFENAESFLRFIKSNKPDLIILDLMLPDMDGFEVCKVLKSKSNFSSIPIIMLTARADETEKVLGLELGADDYVTKPFSPRELVARVKAVLRRHGTTEMDDLITIRDTVSIDMGKHEVTVNEKKIELTSTEFKILSLLASRKGFVFSRDAILEHLWGNEKTVIDRTVDVHIKHLREKLGTASSFIKNIRGLGYKIEE